MASEASLIVMYGVTVWNPSGTGLTSPLICLLSRFTSSNAIRVYAQTTSSRPGCLHGSRGRRYGALIEREPERVCEFRRIRSADQHCRCSMPAGAITQSAGETGD